jgi:hypothetical protein
MVFEEEMSIYLAAKLLQLRYSTAKAIAKKYETEGVIFRPKIKKNKKKKVDAIAPISMAVEPQPLENSLPNQAHEHIQLRD